MPVICNDIICNRCVVNHVKDPLCGGDFTTEGKLLSFCPICGKMLPYLGVAEEVKPSLSKSKRRMVGVKVAKIHGIGFKEMYEVVRETDGEDFAESLCFRLKIVFGVDLEKKEIESLF